MWFTFRAGLPFDGFMSGSSPGTRQITAPVSVSAVAPDDEGDDVDVDVC